MITADWARHMARYNRWQNDSLVAAADGLDGAARELDRGAFFGSIQRTFSHLLWGDTIWIARFDGGKSVSVTSDGSLEMARDWAQFKSMRTAMDQRIGDWASTVTDADIKGVLTWYSKAVEREMSVSRAVCIMQIFNHQTHHRGQIHAMLTSAGATTGDTDLPFMPEGY